MKRKRAWGRQPVEPLVRQAVDQVMSAAVCAKGCLKSAGTLVREEIVNARLQFNSMNSLDVGYAAPCPCSEGILDTLAAVGFLISE